MHTGLRQVIRAAVGVALAGTLLAAPPSEAAPAPIEKVPLDRGGPAICRDDEGTVVFEGTAHTYESLVRGPLYAPVTFWLGTPDPAPVLPVSFSNWLDGVWSTADGGPPLSGQLIAAVEQERPIGKGPAVAYTGPTVRCELNTFGFEEFGTYQVTARMAAQLDLPPATIGRSVAFAGEGSTTAVTPRYLFPTTASVTAPTLPTPVADSFPRKWFPRPWSSDPLSTQTVNGGIECLRRTDSRVLYRGSAWTLAPLVRGHTWSPMAFWLRDGRVISPSWFWTYTGDGVWTTVDTGPARTGAFDVAADGRPSGYARTPSDGGVECRWDNPFRATYRVTPALLAQVPDLPDDLLGRRVELYADYSQTYAYLPEWQLR